MQILGGYHLLVCTILLQKCCMLPSVVTSGRCGGGGGASQQGARGIRESSFRCASCAVGGGVFSRFVFVPSSRKCLWHGSYRQATLWVANKCAPNNSISPPVGIRMRDPNPTPGCRKISARLPEDIRKPLGNTRTLLMY